MVNTPFVVVKGVKMVAGGAPWPSDQLPVWGGRKEQPVEDVLEFGAEEEIEPAFLAEPEIPAEAHRLGGGCRCQR